MARAKVISGQEKRRLTGLTFCAILTPEFLHHQETGTCAASLMVHQLSSCGRIRLMPDYDERAMAVTDNH
jgi:hypothetical protein